MSIPSGVVQLITVVANSNLCHPWVLFLLSDRVLVTQTDLVSAVVDTPFRVILYLNICLGLGALSALLSLHVFFFLLLRGSRIFWPFIN